MPGGNNANKDIKKMTKEEKAIESAKEAVENNKRRERFLERFGPDSKLDESGRSVFNEEHREKYKSLKLPRPQGLTDDMIALIAFGDALDTRRLNKKLTSSSPGGNQSIVDFNQTYIQDNNLEDDPRTEGFGPMLCESKANTITILEEYQNGNKKPAQEAINTAIKLLTSTIGTERSDLYTGKTYKEAFRIITEMRKVPGLDVDNMLTDKEKTKIAAFAQKMQATDKAAEAAAELLEKMPPANSPDREKLVMEFIFNSAVASEGYNKATERSTSAQMEKVLCGILDQYTDFDPRCGGKSELLLKSCIADDAFNPNHYISSRSENIGRDLLFSNNTLATAVLEETVFPAEGILAADGNSDRLRKLSEDAIKRSEYFKQLMSAATVLDLQTMIGNVPHTGFAAYPEVVIPDDGSKKFSDGAADKKFEAKKQEIENNIREYMKDVYPQQYAEKFGGELKKPELSKNDKSTVGYVNLQYDLCQKRQNAVVDIFGAEGKLNSAPKNTFDQKDIDDYNAITLKKPKGLGDEAIALIALGAAMNPIRLNKKLTTSSKNTEDLVEFNQDYILTDILPGDDRSKDFGSILVAARKEAASILESYENGDLEPAKEALKRVAEKNLTMIGSRNMRTTAQNAESNLHRLLQNLKKDHPEFGLDTLYNEALDTKEKVNAVQQEYSKKALEAQRELFNELPPPNSPERKRLVLDHLFCKEVASAGYSDIDDNTHKAMGDAYKISEKYGAMFPEYDMTGTGFYDNRIVSTPNSAIMNQETMTLRANIINATNDLELMLRQSNFTAVEGIIAADGLDELKKNSKACIERSVEYLKMVNAKDIDTINEVMKVTSDGSFEKKFLYTPPSNYAKDLKSKNDKYDKKLAGLSKDIDEFAKKAYPDRYTDTFDPKKLLNDAVALLGSDRRLHINSKEIKKAREDAQLLKQAMNSSRSENVMEDPKVREALLNAYKSSIKYKTVKKTDAKVALDDHTWTPKSEMGKNRYKGVSIIVDLAREYIPDEIARLANEEIKAEEAATAQQTIKQYADKELEGYELTDTHMKNAQARLKAKAEEAAGADTGRSPSLAEIPVGASALSDELAHVIAANLLGRSYDQIPDGVDLVDDYEAKYGELIEDTKKDIQEGDDFKAMVEKLTPEEAVKLGLTKDGKGLMLKLAETSRSLLKEEKKAGMQKEAQEKQLDHRPQNGPRSF